MMNIRPKIETIQCKKFVGMPLEMSLAENRTGQLWKAFMPRKNEVKNTLSEDVISLQVYPTDYFKGFSPSKMFTKWALKEVENLEGVPKGMREFNLPGGMYAVFDYKGPGGNGEVFQYIYSSWLPKSGYELDDRPHFEVLGKNYKRDHPDSEEEIWIPIK